MIDLFGAAGHMHYSKSVRFNMQTISLTYQNNTHGYISNFLKRIVIHYVLAVFIRPVYELVLLQSRSLCDTSMHTMHQCAEIHKTMLELTGNANKTSEQHCELGVARIRESVKDLQIIHCWFMENYPFPEKTELMFISTGLTAPQDSDVNRNKANEINAKMYPLIIRHSHLQKCPKKRRLLLYLQCIVHIK